jgi:hypothetical protein
MRSASVRNRGGVREDRRIEIQTWRTGGTINWSTGATNEPRSGRLASETFDDGTEAVDFANESGHDDSDDDSLEFF